MNFPSIIRLKTSITLPSVEDTANSQFKSARKKIRNLLKLDDFTQRENLDFNILSQIKPSLLIHARLNIFPYHIINSRFSIETEKIESQVEGKNHRKVSCVLISKEYLINSYTEKDNYAIIEIADLKKLSDLKKGKPIKFEKISYFTTFIEICYEKPLTV